MVRLKEIALIEKKYAEVIIKPLSILVLILQTTSMAFSLDLNTTNIQNSFGSGKNTQYYKWNKDKDQEYYTLEKTSKNMSDIRLYHDYSLERITTGNDETNIIGDFVDKTINAQTGSLYGGAIYNGQETLGNIVGDFIGNNVTAGKAYGGTIFNTGTIGNINGDFVANYAYGPNYRGWGGAIFNKGELGELNGDFVGNHI